MRDGRIRPVHALQARRCPVCGTPVKNPKRTYCSDTCRDIAETQRRRDWRAEHADENNRMRREKRRQYKGKDTQ